MVAIAILAFVFWSTHDLLWVPASADGHRYATASATAVAITGSIYWIWIGQVRSSDFLLANGAFWILYRIRSEPARLYWAWRRARQLRAGTAGGR
jgi:hypothetical protein